MALSELNSFEAIAGLSADEQRRLVHSNAPVERLWAAWALGLRAGAAALPDLQTAAAQAPEPGLRGHLAIMLAGLGERELVQTLALHDPAELVRTVAGEHWLRTAPPATQLADEPVVAQLLHDPSADVRLAVFRELLRLTAERQLPGLPIAELALLAADPEPDIRRLAIETLATLPDAAAVRALAERLAVEPDRELVGWLAAHFVDVGQPVRLLESLCADASARDTVLLRTLVDRGRRFTWQEIRPLADRGLPALDEYLVRLLNPDEHPAVNWLLACAVRTSYPSVEVRAAIETQLDWLVPNLRADRLNERERQMCLELLRIIELRRVYAEDAVLDDYGDDSDPNYLAALHELHLSDWYQRDLRHIAALKQLIEPVSH